MNFNETLLTLAEELLNLSREAGIKIVIAESCTGGLISACLTAVPGASDVVERGFVTYTNRSKVEMLGVGESLLARHGAVSEEVSRAMAEGALGHAGAGLGIAVTGIAGPAGGTPDKPVGLVHMACARTGFDSRHKSEVFSGNRTEIRAQAVEHALLLATELIRL